MPRVLAWRSRCATHSSAAWSVARCCRLDELDVQAERLELLDEDVEALGQARLERVLALDDGLVHARAAHDVVALDGEELLERVRGAVRFHRPHFHLAETLTAELRLAAQRLLRDERVRPDRRAWILSSTRWWSLSMYMTPTVTS